MPDHEQEFNASYWRVTASTVDGVQFLDHFYELFMGQSEEVASFFVKTDFKKQKRMLMLSLTHIAGFDPHQGPDQILTDLAADHRELQIPGHLFALWLDSLLEAVRKFDPDHSDVIHEAWLLKLTPGVDYMVSESRS